MPLKDRLWKFQKRRRIIFFRLNFQYFLGLNSAAQIFTHTYLTQYYPCNTTHLTISLPHSPLTPHPSFPPCAIKWGIYSTLKEVQISLYPATSSRDKIPYVTPIMHASSCGKYRCRTPASQVSHPVSSSHDLINILSFGRVRIAGAHDPAEREDVKRDDIVEIHWPYYLLDCVLHKESFCLIAESCWDGWT